MNSKQRQKDEREVANNCIAILQDLFAQQMQMESKVRKDKQPYIEFVTMDKVTGEKRTFMRIDVLCRIFEE